MPPDTEDQADSPDVGALPAEIASSFFFLSVARQYEKGEPEGWALDDEITQALDEFRSLLLAPPFPAVLKCLSSGLPPALVLSDAQWRPEIGRPFGFGQIGLVIKIPQEGGTYRVLFAKSTVPEVALARQHELWPRRLSFTPSS